MTRRLRTAIIGLCLSALGCGGCSTASTSETPPAVLVETVDTVTPAADAGALAPTVYRGARLSGGGPDPVDVAVANGRVLAIGPVGTVAAEVVVDVTGRWLAPGGIDSHVHVVYAPAASALVAGGIVAAVDHAAPPAFFTTDFGALHVVGSGPMITATMGYPTQGWGADGYGREVIVGDVPGAVAAVDALVAQGAALVKVPLAPGARLTTAQLEAIAARAHVHGKKLSVHALTDADAALAAAIGADVLAHCPTEPLKDATVTAWSTRAVIATLSAFGGASVANLKRLAQAGATVLYGTDFGNTTVEGISPAEIGLMQQAGISGSAILAALTTAPAAFWGLADHGAIAPGKRAAFLVLAKDPGVDPLTLAAPVTVVR